MKKTTMFFVIVLAALAIVSCPTEVNPNPEPGTYSLSLVFSGPSTPMSVVYAAWIEDEAGNDIQNVYVCNRILWRNPNTGELWDTSSQYKLTGDAIPNWLMKKYKKDESDAGNKEIDGVTGASTQRDNTMTAALDLGSVTKFRICFEIDCSNNGNEFFYRDRPAFTYKSAIVDLSLITASSPASVPLTIDGWMSNGTGEGNPDSQYSQQPIKEDKTDPNIPGYATYKYMTGTDGVTNLLDFIAPDSDLVTSLNATITKN